MVIAAIRYNNPGNVSLPIKGYDGPGTVVGIKGQAGYASFPTMEDGLRAQTARITSYLDGSTRYGARTTIASLNGVYAEDQNWKNNVSRLSGIGINERIDPNNPQQVAALQGAIIRQETGKDPSAFGFNPSSIGGAANSNGVSAGNALGYSSPGFSPVGTDNPGGIATAGSVYKGSDAQLQADAASGTVNLDFADGDPGKNSGGGFNPSNPSVSNLDVGGTGVGGAAGGASGSFGLGGIMANGSAVGAGNSGAGGTSSGPVGFNAGGPVTANPDLVSATNKVAANTKEGDKAITDGVKTAGQTIGQAITSASSSWLGFAGDTFLRLAFIVVGLVLFAAALWYFARPQITAAASTVASVIPEARLAGTVAGLAKRRR